MIDIRPLTGVDFETMTAAFNDAFSDYDIPAKYTTEYLTSLVLRRGYRPELAVGAFDRDGAGQDMTARPSTAIGSSDSCSIVSTVKRPTTAAPAW